MKLIFTALLLGLLASPRFEAGAEVVSSEAVGAVNLAIRGNSDTVLAVPLAARPVYSGRVASVAAAAAGRLNVNVLGVTGWSAGQWADLYHVRFTSGARNGMYYTITANAAAQITLDPAGDDLSGVGAGDLFRVYRYGTLAELFPPTAAGTTANPLIASVDLTAGGRRSEILRPDNVSAGINLKPAETYFFTAGGGWVSAKTGNAAAGDTILWPDTFLIVRQPAGTKDSVWTARGSVVGTRLVIPLATRAGGRQDNALGLIRPVAVRLGDAFPPGGGFVDSLGAAGFQRRDTLLVFDNAAPGRNKSAAKSYFRMNGAWYSDVAGNPPANDDLLPAGAGFLVRKFKQPGSVTAWWTNDATF